MWIAVGKELPYQREQSDICKKMMVPHFLTHCSRLTLVLHNIFLLLPPCPASLSPLLFLPPLHICLWSIDCCLSIWLVLGLCHLSCLPFPVSLQSVGFNDSRVTQVFSKSKCSVSTYARMTCSIQSYAKCGKYYIKICRNDTVVYRVMRNVEDTILRYAGMTL